MHCHLRQDAMCELVTPLIRVGGSELVYVMPNLQPPITQVSQAVRYHEILTRLAPGVTFLMSLFLHPSMNENVIAEAARSKIISGVSVCSTSIELYTVTERELGETLPSRSMTSEIPGHVLPRLIQARSLPTLRMESRILSSYTQSSRRCKNST